MWALPRLPPIWYISKCVYFLTLLCSLLRNIGTMINTTCLILYSNVLWNLISQYHYAWQRQWHNCRMVNNSFADEKFVSKHKSPLISLTIIIKWQWIWKTIDHRKSRHQVDHYMSRYEYNLLVHLFAHTNALETLIKGVHRVQPYRYWKVRTSELLWKNLVGI